MTSTGHDAELRHSYWGTAEESEAFEAASSDDSLMRLAATFQLAELGTAAAEQMLHRLAADPDPLVANAASIHAPETPAREARPDARRARAKFAEDGDREPLEGSDLEYLIRIRSKRLLSDSRIRRLLRQMQAGQKAAQKIALIDDASDDVKWVADLERAVERGKEAREQLIVHNVRLAHWQGRKYAHSQLPLADLVSAASVGLIKGIDRFDPENGAKLATYVTWWIRQSVARMIDDEGRIIRLPVHLREQIRAAERAVAVAGGARIEDVYEIAAQSIDVTLERIHELLEKYVDAESLDALLEVDVRRNIGDIDLEMEEEPLTAADLFQAQAHLVPTPFEASEHDLLRADLELLLADLCDRDREVIEKRFGWNDDHARTLEEIGCELGVTRERIRQIESKALARLRRSTRSGHLKHYLD